MSKTIKQFDFEIFKMKKGDRLPFNPYIEIVLNYHGRQHATNMPVISPNLMTESEIDDHVRLLKADLDAVAKRAKASLLKAKAETMTLVSDRVQTKTLG